MSFSRLLAQKKGFLAAVYATLLAQVLVTFASMQTDWARSAGGKHLLAVALGMLAVVLALAFLPLPPAARLLLLTGFSVLAGAMLRRVSDRLPAGALKSALVGAAGVFVAMSALGFGLAAAGVDVGPMGLWLFAGLLGLVVAQVVMAFARPSKQSVRLVLTLVIVLFSLYTLHDTNQILQKDYAGDFVAASLDFYLDFLNLFTAMSGQS